MQTNPNQSGWEPSFGKLTLSSGCAFYHDEQTTLDFWLKQRHFSPPNLVVKLDSVRQVELSPKLRDIANAIEESKYILEIEADFDDEGSQGCQFSTWEKAINFLVKYSQWALKSFNYIIDRPKIYDGPDSSVDILWKTESYRLLINFPQETTQPASFYGDDRAMNKIKGTFDPQKNNLGLLMFLLGAQ